MCRGRGGCGVERGAGRKRWRGRTGGGSDVERAVRVEAVVGRSGGEGIGGRKLCVGGGARPHKSARRDVREEEIRDAAALCLPVVLVGGEACDERLDERQRQPQHVGEGAACSGDGGGTRGCAREPHARPAGEIAGEHEGDNQGWHERELRRGSVVSGEWSQGITCAEARAPWRAYRR